MRHLRCVFALVPDCHAGPGRYASLWRRHFYGGLARSVPALVLPRDVDFAWARPAATASAGPSPERALMSERLFDQIRAARPDAVISYCFASDLERGLVERVVEHGIPWINFFCDSIAAFDRVAPLARAVSLNWFPESQAEPRFRDVGRPLLCRPYALSETALHDSTCHDAVHPVGFVGAPFTDRVTALGVLRLLGCRVTVRGEGWSRKNPPRNRPATRSPDESSARQLRGGLGERVLSRLLRSLVATGAPLDDEALPGFVSSCRVVLGLNRGRDAQGRYHGYLKSRDLEFPGYGACYLTQHNDDVARAFEVGREVLTFRNLAEAARQAREMNADPARARSIGAAGRRRVLAEHTWATRLGELARAL